MTKAELELNRLLRILNCGGSVRDDVLAAAERAVASERSGATSVRKAA